MTESTQEYYESQLRHRAICDYWSGYVNEPTLAAHLNKLRTMVALPLSRSAEDWIENRVHAYKNHYIF